MASLLLEGLLAALLVATIVYAALLDRRLRTLRQSRDEMQAMLVSFTAATAQAQSGLVALREMSQTGSAELQGDIERAKALRDDLNFLLDRGNGLADRLEGGIGAARVAVKAAPRKPEIVKSAEPERDAEPRPVVRLSDTPKRAQAVKGMIPGAKVLVRHSEEAAEGDEDMARELLRALKTAR
ncbi:MAG TPA: DUF6468 domain-containing protein [Alphaproteobacteria bacterium]|jgi:hypothetical protein